MATATIQPPPAIRIPTTPTGGTIGVSGAVRSATPVAQKPVDSKPSLLANIATATAIRAIGDSIFIQSTTALKDKLTDSGNNPSRYSIIAEAGPSCLKQALYVFLAAISIIFVGAPELVSRTVCSPLFATLALGQQLVELFTGEFEYNLGIELLKSIASTGRTMVDLFISEDVEVNVADQKPEQSSEGGAATVDTASGGASSAAAAAAAAASSGADSAAGASA